MLPRHAGIEQKAHAVSQPGRDVGDQVVVCDVGKVAADPLGRGRGSPPVVHGDRVRAVLGDDTGKPRITLEAGLSKTYAWIEEQVRRQLISTPAVPRSQDLGANIP